MFVFSIFIGVSVTYLAFSMKFKLVTFYSQFSIEYKLKIELSERTSHFAKVMVMNL